MRALAVLCVLAALAALAAAQTSSCPNGCSSHGTCLSNGTCACASGWTGSDCSYSVTPLPPNQAISDSVAARMWKFYLLNLATPVTSLVFSLNQTSAGDCDLYIRRSQPPSRYDYDARDISTSTQMTISWPNAIAGAYWVGAFGYTGCSYTVAAAVSGGGSGVCPNGCSGHGSCRSGVCVCTPPWNGTDCSLQLSALPAARPTQGHVDQRAWVYYSIFVGAAANEMSVVVNQSSAYADCDLYLRQGALPTLHDYDYRQASDQQDFSLAVTEPALGAWYAGVYGFTACDYTIELLFEQDCPNQCSLHGSCPQTTSCVCSSGFTGAYCETMTPPLMPGVAQVGFAGDNAWNYYHFNAFSADNMLVQVNQTSPNADCDVYLQSDAQPTRFEYDYRDISFNANMSLSVPNPADRTWYIGVYGYRACAYNILVTTTSSCPNACSGNGICFSGVCLCDPSYSGNDCSVTLSTLASGQLVGGAVAQNQWAYFRLAAAPAGTAVASVTAAVREASTQGLVWVYAAAQVAPSLRAYDHADTTQGATHVLHFSPEGSEASPNTVWTIGVYGSPFMAPSQTVNFTLVTWVAAL